MMNSRIDGKRKIVGLFGWLALHFAVAAAGSYFRPGEWYAQLEKPAWNPPNWLFAPVWSTLYLLMSIAAWLVWQKGGFQAHKTVLSLYLVQLFLNLLWSPLFFGLHWMGIALVEMGFLWLAILGSIMAFRQINLVAAGLLIPYLLWVSFAFFLNFTLWRLNS